MFVPYASEIWAKLYGPNYMKFWASWPKKKWVFYSHFWQRDDAILEDITVVEIIV